MTVIVIGAVLLVAGVVYMAGAALRRGQLSDPHAESSGLMPGLEAQGFTASGPTLEPSRRGLRIPWHYSQLAGIADAGRRRCAVAVGGGLTPGRKTEPKRPPRVVGWRALLPCAFSESLCHA